MQMLSRTPLTSLLVVALAAPGAYAQEDPGTRAQDAGEATAEKVGPATAEKADEKARTHVIHLKDGRVLRVRARETDDGWQIRQGRDWMSLPADAVERAVLEGDLKKAARKLERAAGKDPVRRVAYADWLIQSGLYTEALQQLDRVLGNDPDQADACALLAKNEFNLPLPPVEPLEAYCVFGAKGGPAVRELTATRLAAHAEVPGLREGLRQELVASSPRRRSFATLALRRTMPGQEVQPLLQRAVLDSSRDVRVGASLALKDVNDAAVIVPVLRALDSKNERVRNNAIESLAVMNYSAAVRPLYSTLR